MTIEEAEKLMCPFGNAALLTSVWHGGGLTQQLRTTATAVWRGRRGWSDETSNT